MVTSINGSDLGLWRVWNLGSGLRNLPKRKKNLMMDNLPTHTTKGYNKNTKNVILYVLV